MLTKLAFKDWYRNSIPFGKIVRQRDFFWFSTTLLFTLLLFIFIHGTTRGIYYKFMDMSMGYVENMGIPIWLKQKKSYDDEKFRKIIQQIENIDKGNIKVLPFVYIDPSCVKLPGYSEKRSHEKGSELPVWYERINDRIEASKLNIRAVSHFHDPLWDVDNEQSQKISTPLEVTLDKSLFQKHFNCTRYNQELKKRQLPIKTVNESEDDLYCLGNNDKAVIWLNVKINDNDKKEWHKFKINWKDRIQTIVDTPILFPLSTYNLIHFSNEVLYQQKIFLGNVSKIITKKGPIVNYTPDDYIMIPRSVLPGYIRSVYCLEPNSLTCLVDTIEHYKDDNYADFFVYIKSRDYQKKLDEILSSTTLVEISEIYEKNLARIKFLDDILTVLKQWGCIVFLILFSILLITQLVTIIEHRKFNYGIMLSKGFTVFQIYYIVFIQILLSGLSSFVVFIALFYSSKKCLSSSLKQIVQNDKYQTFLNIANFDILPLNICEISTIFFIALLITIIFAYIRLFLLGLKQNTEVSILIHK